MYYDSSYLSSSSIPIVFSYNYTGQSNGSYWGLAYFNKHNGTYTFALPIQPAQTACEQLPPSVITKLPIGIVYNFVEYVKNCY